MSNYLKCICISLELSTKSIVNPPIILTVFRGLQAFHSYINLDN